jgi:16S rRNA (cytidine1402-2'-O)-methyltransferase
MSEARSYFIGPAEQMAPSLAAGLHVTATPIGNLGDVTLRALATLAAADVILCEDTRITSRLLERYGIRRPMKPYHEHNAEKVRPAIIAALQAGAAYALVSDAGVPLVSDPGYRLVKSCVENDIAVTALPGASAVLTALALSGLPTDCFTFIGFLPQRQKARHDLLMQFKAIPSTLIAFESPHRIVDALSDISMALGDRRVAVARELTKLHEEVLRGTAEEVRHILASRDSVKGEICLVIAPPEESAEQANDDDIENAITVALSENQASKAAALVAKTLGMPKEDIYARILKRKAQDG